MKDLKGTQTEENLKRAFSVESQTAMRYEYFASRANIEGHNDVAMLFSSSAAGERGHALGHLEFLRKDPVSGNPMTRTRLNIQSAIAGETTEYHDMYPRMAEIARDEGFEEIAIWFETLAKAERSHANQFQKALNTLLD
ncbi:rubrerythrin family protein [Oxalobacter vibrioformis]|uniref:Rubrerythrin family protein n=1 Tax=Oxalobacter vibrioformis TaxID=933080 RepID=A0A9E9LXM1_9BURK|nr:rubrerythrin family protein [Oxalobacter vibrioformis]WAW09460.1 rubrerythrin family protein [Oxalobacter vibrioformis]